MITLAHWVFLIFVVFIILTLFWKNPPVLSAAIGLFVVGFAYSRNPLESIQISFRALSLATTNLLSVILLIGIVVALTRLLKDTGADQRIVQPLLRLNRLSTAYWLIGIAMWILTLMIWPTPAITLLGAVVVPALKKVGLNPLGLALSLTLFGEGLGLSGDFIIQGAPSLLSKSTGIPVPVLINESLLIVLSSGLLAVLTGSLLLKFKLKDDSSPCTLKDKNLEPTKVLVKARIRHSPNIIKGLNRVTEEIDLKKSRILGLIAIFCYGLTVLFMFFFKIRGDAASALVGGTTLLILCIGVFIQERRKAFTSFVGYLKDGLRFSIGIFVPIVVMSSFFFLGTKTGFQQIFHNDGQGFFSDFAYRLSEFIPLNSWSVGGIIVLVAILGSMDGSGFSSLPLVGGIAIALSQAAQLPAVPFAILGQIIGIWTGAALIPWGFSSVTSAITEVDSRTLFRLTLPCYLVAIITAFFLTMLRI
ncbi:citrate transporter [Desulfitobacterium metallireducens DSM 15288]|uniref:Citrate transporter n=1 Tax=Desulfitobacterium metallireducens DSM 15288 TaxID=871968 RepID=W0ECB6_9FIRM|nr:citrate transporter [Desulfitobacterium metallireducens DSM 15288]